MNRNKVEKQSGFAVLEPVLIIVVLAVIGFTGWYVSHNSQKTAKQAKVETLTQSHTTGLKLSSSPTFYDCMDQVSAHDSEGDPSSSTASSKYHFDRNTGDCTMNGQTFAYPTKYSDDMIQVQNSTHTGYTNAKNIRLTTSETAYLRSLGKDNIRTCNLPANGIYSTYLTLNFYGESKGKYLYYGIGCDSGHREVAVMQDSKWKVVYSAQDIIACDTITKYDIPHSLFNEDNADGSTAQCFQGQGAAAKAVDLSSL
jgi:hypothetical protein